MLLHQYISLLSQVLNFGHGADLNRVHLCALVLHLIHLSEVSLAQLPNLFELLIL